MTKTYSNNKLIRTFTNNDSIANSTGITVITGNKNKKYFGYAYLNPINLIIKRSIVKIIKLTRNGFA
jgi:hypothetical protein